MLCNKLFWFCRQGGKPIDWARFQDQQVAQTWIYYTTSDPAWQRGRKESALSESVFLLGPGEERWGARGSQIVAESA
jgi:hypothetical protein